MSESPPDKTTKPPSRSRRITGLICNSLATLIILYGGWMVGWEMIDWWGEPVADADPRQAALETLGRGSFSDPSVPHSLQTAEMTSSLGRQHFTGERKAAMAELRRRCRTICRRSERPVAPARPAELKMLATLQSLPPAEHGRVENGKTASVGAIWEIFQLDGPLPMVAGTLMTAAKNGKTATPGDGGEVAPFGRRVVCWGLALAASENEWTLFTYHPSGGSMASVEPTVQVSLPPGAERTLTLRSEEGGAIVGFRQRSESTEQNSNETPQAWMRFFDQWFVGQGYSSAFNWRELQGAWYARFEHAESGRIEIQLAEDQDHIIKGTLVLTPAPSRPRE